MWIAYITFEQEGAIKKETEIANTPGQIYKVVGRYMNREKVIEVLICRG